MYFRYVQSPNPSTWMSQEFSKWLGSVGYNPNIPHLKVGYNPFTNHLLTSNGTSKQHPTNLAHEPDLQEERNISSVAKFMASNVGGTCALETSFETAM